MTTKSHYDFAVYLLRNYTYFSSDSANTAFLLGCVKPDVNVTTYLKGSLSYQPLRGHNYPNLTPCVKTLLRKIQYSDKAGFLYYYRVGKLVHYLTDAFTYPHNSNFTGNLHEHTYYEQQLESLFSTALLGQATKPKVYDAGELYSFFLLKHEKYLKQQPKADVDIHFILEVFPVVFRSLCVPSSIPFIRKKESKIYESSFNI